MSIGRMCDRVQAEMEAWSHSPPEWAQAHLRACRACAEAWQTEQRYRHLVQAVRQEHVPACTLRWEQIQAQLTGRAIRQRTLQWRLALSTAFVSIALLVVFGGMWWFSSGREGTMSAEPTQMVVMRPTEEDASPTQKPEVGAKSPPSKEREVSAIGTAPASPAQTRPKREVEQDFVRLTLASSKPSKTASPTPPYKSSKARGGAAVALLPLPEVRPQMDINADYLPVQYGMSSEESNVYSF